ncbi:MAG TPA: 3-methylcrotonyl-CoA carboxylase, partial [Halomonas sp.]|nr:3-methylcrotonyl-CoA carboxylase [Halomonas sp.]
AKLIVHGVDRDAALATLNRALAALDVQGVVTNRAFLQRLANHPGFKNVELDTRFIERNEATLFAPHQFSTEDYASAALIGLHQLAQECESDSPWGRHDGFRLNAPHTIRIALCDPASAQAADNDSAVVVVEGKRATLDTQWQLTIGNSTLTASLQPLEGDAVAVTLNGHRRRLQAYKDGHV